MLENLNTWSVSLKELIKIRRLLIRNPEADKELYDIIDVYSELYYAEYSETASGSVVHPRRKVVRKQQNNSAESTDVESDGEDVSNNGRLQPRADNVAEMDANPDEDIDNFLQSVIKEEHKPTARQQKSGGNMTDMQKAALKVLDTAELEAKQMDAIINARRKQMEKDMHNPPVKPVNFTVSDTVHTEPAVNSKENKDDEDPENENADPEDGEVIEEIEITDGLELEQPHNIVHPSTLDLENALKSVMSNITNDPSMHPLISMQKEQSIFAGLPGYTEQQPDLSSVPVMQEIPPTAEKNKIFKTPEVPEFDPKYGPLFSMTAYQRAKLYKRWFTQAAINVDAQTAAEPVSPNTRHRLIREETTRLQNDYLETR
jgi:hypothetical protein